MPSLEAYRAELDYSYAPGIFPSMECLLSRPSIVRRVLVHSAAAAVFGKFSDALDAGKPHVVLHHPGDSGNVGTILRTALGLGISDVALIRPCVDVFDPRTVRASMGSLFQLRVKVYDDFDEYMKEYDRQMYPFMLDASVPIGTITEIPPVFSLVFGNEGSGLPKEFATFGQPVRIESNDKVDSLNLAIAAGIGIYHFMK